MSVGMIPLSRWLRVQSIFLTPNLSHRFLPMDSINALSVRRCRVRIETGIHCFRTAEVFTIASGSLSVRYHALKRPPSRMNSAAQGIMSHDRSSDIAGASHNGSCKTRVAPLPCLSRTRRRRVVGWCLRSIGHWGSLSIQALVSRHHRRFHGCIR